MKKLILSAVLALACFTAQSKNEVISNDDKNPKSKTKTVAKAEKPEFGYCKVTIESQMVCNGVPSTVTTSAWSYLGCGVAFVTASFFHDCE